MNELKIFNYDDKEIRTQLINNEIWFVGKDVAGILGYQNPRDALHRHVDIEDKKDGVVIYDSIGREQTPIFINESGLYSLILSSKLEGAKKFKKWVTSEVLPSIRKHGAYMTNDTLEKALTSPEFLIQLATNLKIEKEKNKQLEHKIENDKSKVIFAEALEISNNNILIGDLAKILKQNGVDIGQNRLFEYLRSNGYLCSRGEQYNSPTQKSLELKLFEVKTRTINNPDGSVRVTRTTKVTPKGQSYFINQFKK